MSERIYLINLNVFFFMTNFTNNNIKYKKHIEFKYCLYKNIILCTSSKLVFCPVDMSSSSIYFELIYYVQYDQIVYYIKTYYTHRKYWMRGVCVE